LPALDRRLRQNTRNGIAAALEYRSVAAGFCAASLALNTQAPPQGACFLAKMASDLRVALDSVDHFKG
jgi:hypothetical protein